MTQRPTLFDRYGLAALGISTGLSAALLWWFPLTWLSAGAVVLTMPLALALWLVVYRRSAAYAQAHASLRGDAERRDTERLRANLVALEETRGAEQLEMLQDKRNDLLTVLRARFGTAELSHARYAQSAELVYQAALENLRETVVARSSVKSIDVDRLDENLRTLTVEATDRDSANEIAAVEARRKLHSEQLEKVRALLAENETALTALANTAAALADTQTGVDGRPLNAEAAIAELERLAARARDYRQNQP